MNQNKDLGASASPKPALLASLPEPVPVSAHSGDGQARGILERLRRYRGGTIEWREIMDVAAARIEALEGALRAIVDGNVPRPIGEKWRADGLASKHDRCIHERWMYEDCENCIETFVRPVLDAGNASENRP